MQTGDNIFPSKHRMNRHSSACDEASEQWLLQSVHENGR